MEMGDRQMDMEKWGEIEIKEIERKRWRQEERQRNKKR